MKNDTRLKQIIKDRGLKQTWIAEQLGINYQVMSRLCGGKSRPSLELAYRITRLLGEKHVEDVFPWNEIVKEDE